jgi:hypothetical protein
MSQTITCQSAIGARGALHNVASKCKTPRLALSAGGALVSLPVGERGVELCPSHRHACVRAFNSLIPFRHARIVVTIVAKSTDRRGRAHAALVCASVSQCVEAEAEE